ncbi:MAG: putative rane protein [bacterium]|nr:putative rane protein [bacterium]
MSAHASAARTPSPTPEPALPPSTVAWPPARRIGFRFLFAYLVLYAFAFAAVSDFDWDWLTLAPLWRAVVPWIGKHVLHLEDAITSLTFGPSDNRYGWVLHGLWLATAVVACVVWSIADRRRLQYERLQAALRVFVRYALAYEMFVYGFVKLFKLQFPAPGPARLMETFGESSPMGLLWAFMGASTPYTIFTGVVETLGGFLLLFRRTTTLGALIVLGAMTNVVMLNFSYDVPIKLLSVHFLLLAAWLVLPDARQLVDVLVLHRPTEPALRLWTPATRGGRWARRVVKTSVIAVMTISLLPYCIKTRREDGDGAPKPPYYGAYEVETFLRNGTPAPQVFGDAQSWRALALDRKNGTLRFGDGARIMFDLPPKNGAIELGVDGHKTPLAFATPDPAHVVLRGRYKGDEIDVTLKKAPDARQLLVNRGFHWLNETPFIR